MAEILISLLPLIIVLGCPAALLLLARKDGDRPAGSSRPAAERLGPLQERITQPPQESTWWLSRYAEDFELWERGR